MELINTIIAIINFILSILIEFTALDILIIILKLLMVVVFFIIQEDIIDLIIIKIEAHTILKEIRGEKVEIIPAFYFVAAYIFYLMSCGGFCVLIGLIKQLLNIIPPLLI